MAYKILTGTCTVCGSCEFDCPSGAVKMKGDSYAIVAAKCTECDGADVPQCISVCPADSIVAA